MKMIYVGGQKQGEIRGEMLKVLKRATYVLVGTIVLFVLAIVFMKGYIFDSEANMSNVVKVVTYEGTGSAVFVGNNKLLTAAHVVSGMAIDDVCDIEFQDPNDPDRKVYAQAKLLQKGDWKRLKEVKSEKEYVDNCSQDYALLSVVGLKASDVAQPCAIASSTTAKVGDKIFVEGYPNGEYSKTDGTINNISGALLKDKRFFIVNAHAWGGNSGGALYDAEGKLLGIVTMVGNYQKVGNDLTIVVKIDHIKERIAID